MAFAVTVAIGVISRTTTDLAITSQMEDSARAFSAAEAGIEEGLLPAAQSTTKTLSAGIKYTTSVADVGGTTGVLTLPGMTTKQSTQTIWLANHVGGVLDETRVFAADYIDVCWTKPAAMTPALVVTIVYKRGLNYLVAKGAYDADSASRSPSNGFDGPTSSNTNAECGSADYRARLTFADFGIAPASDILLMLRIRPVYGDTTISVDSPVLLPLQGKRVESTGTTAGGTNRKIVVFQQYPSAESFFDAALYSQTNLVK